MDTVVIGSLQDFTTIANPCPELVTPMEPDAIWGSHATPIGTTIAAVTMQITPRRTRTQQR